MSPEEERGQLLLKVNGHPGYRKGDDDPKNGTISVLNHIKFTARAELPTRFGTFTLAGFLDERDGKEHTAVIQGDVAGKTDCPMRVHSECHTGDVLGSLRCDCRDQLEAALRYISKQEYGVVIYLRQEGRGIGLLNKIKAYHLQDMGLDTVEANRLLGLPDDARDYVDAALITRLLRIQSVALLTNNPEKIDSLKKENIEVTRRIPLVTEQNRYNENYLKTKVQKMGHLINTGSNLV
ncbi:MAG: GTP cyclohydrolase II [Spirochaetales bacterium]|nr:GTP cyclohydrolase II [Spirochaetales bacterium]MCF7938041.1 GTP cyclohydrolase II [Spirochaetales bacterium]